MERYHADRKHRVSPIAHSCSQVSLRVRSFVWCGSHGFLMGEHDWCVHYKITPAFGMAIIFNPALGPVQVG